MSNETKEFKNVVIVKSGETPPLGVQFIYEKDLKGQIQGINK